MDAARQVSLDVHASKSCICRNADDLALLARHSVRPLTRGAVYRSHTLLGRDVEMQDVLASVDLPVVVARQFVVGEAPKLRA